MNKKNLNYFHLRKVSEPITFSFKLPAFYDAFIPKTKTARILDIGCGFGEFLGTLKNLKYVNMYGIDISLNAIEYCKSKNLPCTLITNLKYFSDNFNDNKFDFIQMSHVLEHIPKSEIIDTLKSIREKMLASNGKIFIKVPNAQSNTGCYWMYEDFTHTTLFTSGSIFYVLKAAGFEKISFVDPDCLSGVKGLRRLRKKLFQRLYLYNLTFWNRVTSSSFHAPSPQIFSYELKTLAEN